MADGLGMQVFFIIWPLKDFEFSLLCPAEPCKYTCVAALIVYGLLEATASAVMGIDRAASYGLIKCMS